MVPAGLPTSFEKFTVKPSQVVGLGANWALRGSQSLTSTCSSFIVVLIKTPFLNSFTQTHTTNVPCTSGAIPLIIPVVGLIVTLAPIGCVPE